MKKLFLAIALLLGVTTAMAQRNTTIKKYEGEALYGLIASGAFDVRISQGEQTFVSVEIREDLAPKLVIDKTEEGFVRINYGSEVGKFFKGNNKPFVNIVVKELRNFNVSGVCTVIGKGEYTAKERSTVIIGGSSSVEFLNIIAPQVTVDISGSANVGELKVETPSLRIDIGGTSKAQIKGQAENCEIASSGTASLDVLMLTCPAIRAVVGGMSLVKANVSGTADVTRSGTASFRYTGGGKVNGDAKPL